jgi:HSP20 family protein
MTFTPYTLQRTLTGAGERPGIYGSSVLRTDIRETEDTYLLETEMPGVKKENVELVRENGVLTILVKAETPENSESYVRRERVFGELKRSFVLKNIDEETISARLDNGILFITLPKQKREQGRINIE